MCIQKCKLQNGEWLRTAIRPSPRIFLIAAIHSHSDPWTSAGIISARCGERTPLSLAAWSRRAHYHTCTIFQGTAVAVPHIAEAIISLSVFYGPAACDGTTERGFLQPSWRGMQTAPNGSSG